MKLAISSTGKELDSNLDPRFGRASYFIILDAETMDFEAVVLSQTRPIARVAEVAVEKPNK